MSTPTTIPPLADTDFANRMAALFPHGWAAPDAKSPGGVLYAIFQMMGGGLAFENSAEIYALAATRIQSAVNGALDLAAQDFLGDRLPRNPGETDASYRARITAALLPTGATRAAIIEAVTNATGYAPRVIEPWRPADTGAWGHGFWGVDSSTTPGRWTGTGGRPGERSLAYQGFVECVLPTPTALNGNPVPCYDSNSFYGIAGTAWIDIEPSTTLGPQAVYDAINLVKCEGTIVWVKFVPAPSKYNWDDPNVTWDESGVTWG
jgi:hypothetical protein